MKIIQSFWSKPSFHDKQDYTNARKFGGWLNFRYFLISTSFSCLTLRKHHKQIELYTDAVGHEIFINTLKLPYDDISLALNQLDNEDHKLWILGKVMAIRMQTRPFIHVDNDAYLWKQLPVSSDPHYLIAQSVAPMSADYRNSLTEIFAHFSDIPDCLKERPGPDAMIANVGLIGGNDIDFFQEFCEVSSSLLERNRQNLPLLNNMGGFNQMMEEYLFTRLAEYKRYKTSYLLDTTVDKVYFNHILRINMVPLVYKYIHLLGAYKQNYYACEQLELRMKYEFPDHYRLISTAINEQFPGLANDNANTERKEKLLEAIHIIYTNSLSDIENMKVRIKEGCEIISAQEFVDPSDIIYAVKEMDSRTGKVTFKRLPLFLGNGEDYLLPLFNSPTSISELFEYLSPQLPRKEAGDLKALKFRLTDAVTKYIVMYGILEFA